MTQLLGLGFGAVRASSGRVPPRNDPGLLEDGYNYFFKLGQMSWMVFIRLLLDMKSLVIGFGRTNKKTALPNVVELSESNFSSLLTKGASSF